MTVAIRMFTHPAAIIDREFDSTSDVQIDRIIFVVGPAPRVGTPRVHDTRTRWTRR